MRCRSADRAVERDPTGGERAAGEHHDRCGDARNGSKGNLTAAEQDRARAGGSDMVEGECSGVDPHVAEQGVGTRERERACAGLRQAAAPGEDATPGAAEAVGGDGAPRGADDGWHRDVRRRGEVDRTSRPVKPSTRGTRPYERCLQGAPGHHQDARGGRRPRESPEDDLTRRDGSASN